jgi:site-specific recombinase XerD
MNVGYMALRKEFEDYLRYRRLCRGKKAKKPIAKRSIEAYWMAVKDMTNKIGNNPSIDQIQNYYETTLLTSYKQNSLTNIITGINHYCDMKELNFHLPTHPPQEIELDIWTEKERDALIEEARKANDLRSVSIFLVLRDIGQREGDVRAIDYNDVHTKDLTIDIVIRKLGSIPHTANITSETLRAIVSYVDKQRVPPGNSKALWTSYYGTRITKTTLRDAIRKYASKAKITKKAQAHIFRHYAINEALEKGLPPKTVMAMFRIKSYRTLLRYSHPTKESIRRGFDRIHNKNMNPSEDTKKESSEPIQSNTNNDISDDDLAKMLTTRLAMGQIDKETYKIALSELKNNTSNNIARSSNLSYFG